MERNIDCVRCEEAKAVLEAIIPYPNDPERLIQWAVSKKDTLITRIVTTYLVLRKPDTDEP
jgi:hypothetical protein